MPGATLRYEFQRTSNVSPLGKPTIVPYTPGSPMDSEINVNAFNH
jgi:hypothetical protein